MKKALVILILASMAITMNAQSISKGDLNNDGILNVTDVVILVDWVLDGYVELISKGDLNNDGILNVTDVVILVDWVLEGYVPLLTYTSCPDDNHPHAIDLELPSGTLWSCCNLDATSPYETGGYYAWGESEVKPFYSSHNYNHIDNTSGEYKDIEVDICGSEYDVAAVKWGGYWQMPSKEQIKELVEYCDFSWSSVAGISGGKFTSKINNSSIFLPTTGFYMNSESKDPHGGGYYWTGTKRHNNEHDAFILCFGYIDANGRNCVSERQYGLPIRPIAK